MSNYSDDIKEVLQDMPTIDSKGDYWIWWHKSLLNRGYSRIDANLIFLRTWNARGNEENTEINTEELRKYMGSQGIHIEPSGWDMFVETVTAPFGLAQAGMQGVASVLAIVLILVIILAVRLLWKLTTDPNETINTAMNLRTGGLLKR